MKLGVKNETTIPVFGRNNGKSGKFFPPKQGRIEAFCTPCGIFFFAVKKYTYR